MTKRQKGPGARALAIAIVVALTFSTGVALAGPNNGHGDTRGNSRSQPDQDGTGMDRGAFNGNEDKPPSGDGNNGCGNDADREDDNNGWCGNKPHKDKEGDSTGSGGGAEVSGAPAVGDEAVLGEAVLGEAVLGKGPPVAEVLGVQVRRPAPAAAVAGTRVSGGALATTGASILALIGFAISAIATGIVLSRRRRASAR